MGMYTGIRFKGVVKEEYREKFEDIALNGKWSESEVSIFRVFGEEYVRAKFIPCGALVSMPRGWQTYGDFEEYSREWFESAQASDGFDRYYNKETGEWNFQCSLKNYQGEIETFIELLPKFINSISHMEVLYEEDDESIEFYLDEYGDENEVLEKPYQENTMYF